MKKIAYNRTKIIATIGPASNKKKILQALIEEGVDVCRMNFSHGTYDDHQKVVDWVREINREINTNVALLLDLQGPKIRIQDVAKNTHIQPGASITITTRQQVGNDKIVSTSYTKMPQEIKIGERILIDDGKIELKTTRVEHTEVIAKVIIGGELLPNKGINLPDSTLSTTSLTPKDIKDIEFAIKNRVEWIALSLVHKPEDVKQLQTILSENHSSGRIIAKIEKPAAVHNIDGIIAVSDAIMIARGDLGVEMWMGEVPIIQKKIIEKCRKAAKPVIVATQMMESMILNSRPTRAETNDVANAVMDGADALMLSAETATGKHSIAVIKSMMKIISTIESQADIYYRFQETNSDSPTFIHDSLILAASKLANQVNAKAIVGMTVSGYTAYKSSAYRPNANIFIFTKNQDILNTMSLVWGVRTYYYKKQTTTDDTIKDVSEILKNDGHLKKGDVFINLASMPLHNQSRTNMIKINQLK